jgi:hypothetical protein
MSDRFIKKEYTDDESFYAPDFDGKKEHYECVVYKMEKPLNIDLPQSIVVDQGIHVPRDVVTCILSFVDTTSWNSVKRTCKAFLNISNAMHLPKYYDDPWKNTLERFSYESALYLLNEGIEIEYRDFKLLFSFESVYDKTHPKRKDLLKNLDLVIPSVVSRVSRSNLMYKIHKLMKIAVGHDDDEILNLFIKNLPKRSVCVSGVFEASVRGGHKHCFDRLKKFIVSCNENPLSYIIGYSNCNVDMYLYLLECFLHVTNLDDIQTKNILRFLVGVPREKSHKYIVQLMKEFMKPSNTDNVFVTQDTMYASAQRDQNRIDAKQIKDSLYEMLEFTLSRDRVDVFNLFLDNKYLKIDTKLYNIVLNEMKPKTTLRLLELIPMCYKLKEKHLAKAVFLGYHQIVERLLRDNTIKGDTVKRIGYTDLQNNSTSLLTNALLGNNDHDTEFIDYDAVAVLLLENLSYDFKRKGDEFLEMAWRRPKVFIRTTQILENDKTMIKGGHVPVVSGKKLKVKSSKRVGQFATKKTVKKLKYKE